MFIGYAGRRIDSPGQFPPRFPLESVDRVRTDVNNLLTHSNRVIGSAACGADLIVLDIARALGVRFTIVLPFAPAKFKATSVTDRPGDWGNLFDELVETAAAAGDLIVLNSLRDPFRQVNQRIIAELRKTRQSTSALIIWEGRSHGGDDLTEEFRGLAAEQDIKVREIRTVANVGDRNVSHEAR